MSSSRISKILLCAFLVAVWLLIATLIALVLPAPWQGLSGRDFRPQGASLSLILLASGMAFRYFLRWPWSSLILGLVAVEIFALLVIGNFSGATGSELLSRFNLDWLAFVNLFIGLPWVAGVGIGELVVRLKARSVRG